jgi:hypothetical protein
MMDDQVKLTPKNWKMLNMLYITVLIMQLYLILLENNV